MTSSGGSFNRNSWPWGMGHCNMGVHKWCVKDLSVCLRISIQGHELWERD